MNPLPVLCMVVATAITTPPGVTGHISKVIPNLLYTADGICEGADFKLDCPKGFYIQLLDGYFGRTVTNACLKDGDPPVDTRELPCNDVSIWDIDVITECEGRRECLVTVTKDHLGINPCPSSTFPKYLNMTYNCIKNRLQSFVCEGSKFVLSCPGGDVMQVTKAMYGRLDPDRCSLNSQIQSTNCSAPDALRKVTSLCNHKRYCEVDAVSTMFEDPCEGTTKLLEIEIQCASCTNDYDTGPESDCYDWAKDGQCDENPQFMMAKCRKACWQCESSDSCEDEHGYRDCQFWAARGECFQNEEWMRNNCQYSCNKCNETFVAPEEETIDRWQHPDPNLAPENTRREVACYDNELLMDCPLNTYIQVYDAFYGRLSPDVCPPEDPDQVTGDYVDCPTSSAPYNRISWVCDGRRDCLMSALNSAFGDLCASSEYYESVDYYLKVNYSCQACENRETDSYCETERQTNGCDSWEMHQKCFKTCTQCEFSENCQNSWSSQVDCDFWSADGECEANENWMSNQCTKSCRLCQPDAPGAGSPGTRRPPITEAPPIPDRTSPPTTTRTTTSVVVEVCENVLGDDLCTGMAADGACQQIPEDMIKTCRKACGFCVPVTLPPYEENCRDELESTYCARIADPAGDNECVVHPDFMAENCRLTCNLCRPLPPTPSTTAGPTTTTTTRSTTLQTTTTAAPTTLSTEKTTAEEPGCVDAMCLVWVADNQCELNPDQMAMFCAEACCKPGDITTTTSTSTTTTATTPTTTPTPSTPRTVGRGCMEMPQYPDADCLSWALTGQCTVNPRGLAVFCTPECCAEEQTSTTKSAVEDNRTVFIPDVGCVGMPRYAESDCKSWVLAGQCELNPLGMAVYCTSECCPEVPPRTTTTSMRFTTTPATVPLSTTVFIPDRRCAGMPRFPGSDCASWVKGGQCTLNPSAMAVYCTSECCDWVQESKTTTTTSSTKMPTSTVSERSSTTVFVPGANCVGMPQFPDSDCAMWVRGGQCTLNPRAMAVYCTPECCAGQVSPTTTETTSTIETTTRTIPTQTPSTTPKTTTAADTECTSTAEYPGGTCDIWAESGQCEMNPSLMKAYCSAACCQPTTTTRTTTTTTTSTTTQSTTTSRITPSTTQSTTPSTTAETTVDPEEPDSTGCTDASQYAELCGAWAQFGQCQDSEQFMRFACPSSCGFCSPVARNATTTTATTPVTTTSTSTLPPTTQACDNRPEYADRCDGWALDQEQCNRAEDFMREYCSKSCGWCPGQSGPPVITTPTTTAPTTTSPTPKPDERCEDQHKPRSQCREWAAGGLCSDSYMINNCKSTCGLCPDPTTPSFTTTIDPLKVNCDRPCLNGRCAGENVCQCDPGYTGLQCEDITCPGDDKLCHGHGECVGPNQCVCEELWTGAGCDTPLCPRWQECNNRGICAAPNECWCYPHYSGSDCLDCDLSLNSSQSCISCPPCTNGKCRLDDEARGTISYKGCYKDQVMRRDLEITAWKENQETTVRDCIRRCHDYGYKYAGLQMGQECHCGDLYGLYGSAENCDVPCTGGAKGEICGGLYANSIYQVYTGSCECNGPQWTGVLCEKCAEGFTGDLCDNRGTTRRPPPRTPAIIPGVTTPVQTLPPVGTRYLPLTMRLMQSWSDSYADLRHPRTEMFTAKIQPALVELYKEIFPRDLENVVILSLREGSVVVNYELVFRGPMPSYNTTLRLACRGQDGHQTEPPEGWIGELILPNGLGTMDYEIPPDSRDPCRTDVREVTVEPTPPPVFITDCENNGTLVVYPNGTTGCECGEDFSGNRCQIEKSGFSRWISLGIIIAVGVIPLLILLIVCFCVCRARDSRAYKTRQKHEKGEKNGIITKSKGDSTTSRTFQFYDMGKKTGATTTIKKSHSKKNPSKYSDNTGYSDDPDEYDHRRV